MEYKDFLFNPIVDKEPVSQTGFVDLKSALVNNCVPADLASTEDVYNGIDDPASILGKPRDTFEAMEMQKYVNNYKSADNDTES